MHAEDRQGSCLDSIDVSIRGVEAIDGYSIITQLIVVELIDFGGVDPVAKIQWHVEQISSGHKPHVRSRYLPDRPLPTHVWVRQAAEHSGVRSD